MTVLTRSFFLLWTFLHFSLCTALANAYPPVLTNPSACKLGLFITEAGCGPANEFQVDVSTAPGTMLGTDVYLKELRLIIRHEWDADLDIHLKSPNGKIVEVSTDNGDTFDNYGNPNDSTCSQYTAFRARAAAGSCSLLNIKDGLAPFIGSFLPEGNFADFNDGSSPVGHWTLMVCDDGAGNLGYLEYVELVFESTACLPPTHVTVLESDSTTARLSWAKGTNCNNVVFEFGPVGFTPGTDDQPGVGGTVGIVNCPTDVISGLAPNSTYDIYLRENCGTGIYSLNSCPVRVTTSCSPPPATIVENFNGQALCAPACGVQCPIVGPWRNASNDNFDWLVNTDTTITENTGPDMDNPGGGNYIYLEASGTACTNNKRAVLVSNCFQVVANADSCDMSFDYHFYGVHIAGMSFEVSVNGGASWTTLWTASGNKGNKWRRKFIDLDAYNGMTAQFRFVGRGGNGKFADLALDNIAFYGSQDLGFPDYVYYLDSDEDGYGNPDLFIASCQPASFAHYVDNGDDCNDQDYFQNPGETELLCDDFDSNCNGFDDEYFVQPVVTQGSVICSGGNGYVVAYSQNLGEIHWYDAMTDGNLVAVGDTFFIDPSFLVNSSLDSLVLTYYAEEITPTGCVSNERTAATVIVLPSPKLMTADAPSNCAGLLFDLNSINISDENGLNGTLSFYDHFPFQPGEEIGPIVTPTATTNYYVVSEASNGCRDTLSVNYTVQPGPVADISDVPTLCRNSSKTISVQNIGNGTPPIQYLWNTGEVTDSILIFSDNTVGTVNHYSVTISDANGCTSADTLSVTTINNINQILTSSSPVTTCNGNDGSISLTPIGGTGPYTYVWAGGPIISLPDGLTLTDLEQGSYAFTVTDNSPEQCNIVVPVVVVNGPTASVEVDDVQHVGCHGGNDGCISLDIVGGPNPTIVWSNNMSGANICGLAAGTYTVTVTDGNCQNILSIPVTQPEQLLVKPETVHVSCTNANDGYIGLNMFGGTPPFSYHWSNNSTAGFIAGLAPGFYDLTVTDAKGCSVVLTHIPVTQPAPISIATLSFQQPTCFGQSNGSISLSATGGLPPYNYSWSNGGTGTSISNIASGSYTVHVRDQNGCSYDQTVNLTQPQQINITTTNTTPPSCAGQQSGSVSIEVTGGNGTYQYAWNNGATTQNLAGIGNGDYTVTVTDGFGCTAVSVIGEVASPEVLTAGIHQDAPFCIGRDENNLEAYVVSGGLPPFTYDWNTDDSGPQLINVSYGNYTVTITDANGCESIHSTTIDSVQVLNLGYQAFPPLCHGQTGQLAVTVSGGTEPYSIVWSDGQTGFVASNLLAQNHAATITDANGCSNMLGIIPLAEPDVLVLNLDNIEDIACHNGSEGTIEITAGGGTAPYQYLWSNGAQTEDASGLSEGSYGVTVTDQHSCTTVINGLFVDAPDQLVPSSSLSVPTGNCQSVSIDNVCVSVDGGMAPFQFAWETGDTTNCLLNPLPGDYHVTITDAAGCTIEFMSVKVPAEYNSITIMPIATDNDVVCFGASTGQLSVQIQGGAVPYQYNWSNSVHGISSNSILTNNNLPVGQYRVTITDNTGCTAVSSLMPISTFGAVMPTIMGTNVQHVHCKGGADGSIPLTVVGGLVPYSFYWVNSAGDSISNHQNINGLAAETYTVIVTDQLGCTGMASSVIVEPSTAFTLNPAIIENVKCYGESTGSVMALASGGDLPYQFEWSNTAMTQAITDLLAGQYTVTATDKNGCVRTGTYFVNSPDAAINVTVLDSASVTCFGENNGFIDIEVYGGTPDYDFNWNNFSAAQNLANAPAGTYLLHIFDSLGCEFIGNYVLGSPPPLLVSSNTSPQTMLSPPNGSASASASGGTPPFHYDWSNGMTSQTINNLETGQYGVTITDGNGCQIYDYVFVDLMLDAVTESQPTDNCFLFPNPTAGAVNFKCEQFTTGELELRVYNPIGQLVLLEKGKALQNGTLKFNLQNQPSDIYQAVFMDETGVVYQGKITVQR